MKVVSALQWLASPFDFRHGSKKSSHLDKVAKLWPNIFQYISICFTKSWFPLVSYQLDKKQNIFIHDMHWDIPGLRSEKIPSKLEVAPHALGAKCVTG